MLTSKFKTDCLFNSLWFIFSAIFSFAFLVKVIKPSYKNEILTTIAGGLIFGTIFIASIAFLDIYKYLKIDLIKKEIKYYSLTKPFGKLIKFNDFIGFIQPTEMTLDGNINTIHFVNKQGITHFKMNISHYKNADDINKAIPLKEIKNYDFGFWLYLKLIFTGRIKVTTMNKNE